MLPRRLDYSRSTDAWERFYTQVNDGAPFVQRKRRKPDGTYLIYQEQLKILPESVLHTGIKLIRCYIKVYEKFMATGLPDTVLTLPAYWTNGVKFGKLFKVSSRSIRNRMALMVKVGFIEKIFHGTKHDYEVRIKPEFLFTPEQMSVFSEEQLLALKLQKNSSRCNISNFKRKQLPDILALELINNVETNTSHVDKNCELTKTQLAMSNEKIQNKNFSSAHRLQNQDHNSNRHQIKHLSTLIPTQLRELGGAVEPTNGLLKSIYPKWQINYVREFWKKAKQQIYLDRNFTTTEEISSMESILEGVYNNFKYRKNLKEWGEFHQNVLKCIELAHRYYIKRPLQYPADPYWKFFKGCGYFDKENTHGFNRVIYWQRDNLSKQKSRAIKLRELKIANKQLENYFKGKCPKWLQEKTLVELYRYFENKFKPHGEDALNRFYLKFSNLNKNLSNT